MSEPMRVAQILNRMDSGGIEAVVMNYYRHIDRNKVQFDFYFAEDSVLPQRRELEQLGAGIYPIPAYTKVFAYQKALYSAFRERHYKVVHANLSTMSVFPLFAAWRAGVPVRICHNHTTANWSEGKRTLLKYLLRPLNKIFATHYFACGEAAGRWMYGNRCFDAGRITVMPNAIDRKRFAYDAAARTALRGELGIPQDAFVVGHVGRFMRQKNHTFLLDIFAQLKKRRQNAYLLLIGEGELQAEIRGLVQEKGLEKAVIFTGARRDVDKLYSAMDVFCLPSLYEGFGLVAEEAQANGLGCILSTAVPPEAVCARNVERLSLKCSAAEWAEKAADAVRLEGAECMDIASQAARFEKKYLQFGGEQPDML